MQKLDLTYGPLAQKIVELQQLAYRVEADLIAFDKIPALKDTQETLQMCGEIFYGYLSANGTLVGAIAYEVIEMTTLDICRLMVHPAHFRQGIAGALLRFVETVEPHIERLTVATGARNDPAVNLYQRYGYLILEEREVEPGLRMAFFEKRISR